jgi:hypothetical protein
VGAGAHYRSLGFARDDKVEGRDFYREPSGRMDREKPQVPTLRSGSTASRDRRDDIRLKFESLRAKNQ